jgi:hypothetical protein
MSSLTIGSQAHKIFFVATIDTHTPYELPNSAGQRQTRPALIVTNVTILGGGGYNGACNCGKVRARKHTATFCSVSRRLQATKKNDTPRC